MAAFAMFCAMAALASPDPGADAAAALALRVLGPRAPTLFAFATLPPGSCEAAGPCALVENNLSPDAVVRISGSSPVEMAYGLAHYCRTALNMSFSWNNTGGNQVQLPPALPRPAAPIKIQKRCSPSQAHCYTYYANVCTLTYSMWSWDWARWEQEIDWMALNGINLVLAYTGREYVYRKVYKKLGLNQSQIGEASGGIEAGPAFLAFSRTESWTGQDHLAPNDGRTGGPLPDSFAADQWTLNKRIVARQTLLGIGSILPAFQGNVPDALRGAYPSANISKDGWLDGLDPLFSKISDMVLAELIADFGRTGFYEADGFFDHTQAPWLSGGRAGRKGMEGSRPPPASAPQPARGGAARAAAVFASMRRADPKAVWVYQGWVFRAMSTTPKGHEYIRGFVGAAPAGRLVVLDMEAESQEIWRNTESWHVERSRVAMISARVT
jgi:alpha-N-acetylglucosaminidase